MTAQATIPHNTIAVGDCLAAMAGWPAGSVDLIFADPPYNIGYAYDRYEDAREDQDYIKWTRAWVDGCARLLKPTGSFYILIGDEYAAETRLHLKQLEENRQLAFRNWIVWHYTFGQNCKQKFNRSHAHLFYCVGSAVWEKKIKGPGPRAKGLGEEKDSPQEALPQASSLKPQAPSSLGPAPFTFNRQAIAVPSARQTTYADARANPAGKLPDDTWYLRPQEADGYFRPEEDTWYLSRLCGTFKERQGWHPCQLPESLLERITLVSSNENDLVFDPFVGSGTTLAVAARLKRRWLGCELSEDYAARATQRIEHAGATGKVHQTNYADKGIVRGKPKKKAEPHRSAGLFK